MLLGFKRIFAPFVEDGSKFHTIRATRKVPPRVGETCNCYVDPRQKTMRLLGRWPCVRVQDIVLSRATRPGTCEMHPWLFIEVDGVCLDFDESNEFAWRDGFRERGPARALEFMTEYWVAEMARHPTHRTFPFRGHLIWWDPK